MEKTPNGYEDLYPRLKHIASTGAFPQTNKVRYEILKYLGYFVTESSEHFAEYVPWFIKRAQPKLISQFNIPLDEYLRRCEQQLADWKTMRQQLENTDEPLKVTRSNEYAASIIAALEGGAPVWVNANILNVSSGSESSPVNGVSLPQQATGNREQAVH